MTRDEANPTPAEWKILRTVHEMSPCAARDIVAVAEEQNGWTSSTTKTLLRRLVQKGHLRTKRVGNSFEYRPTRSAHKLLCKAADGLLDNAVEGAVGPLLAYMVEKSRLSEAELDELRALLDEKKGKPAGSKRRKSGGQR